MSAQQFRLQSSDHQLFGLTTETAVITFQPKRNILCVLKLHKLFLHWFCRSSSGNEVLYPRNVPGFYLNRTDVIKSNLRPKESCMPLQSAWQGRTCQTILMPSRFTIQSSKAGDSSPMNRQEVNTRIKGEVFKFIKAPMMNADIIRLDYNHRPIFSTQRQGCTDACVYFSNWNFSCWSWWRWLTWVIQIVLLLQSFCATESSLQ